MSNPHRPDFAIDSTEIDGVTLTCKRVAPGLTMSDLARIFDEAYHHPEADNFSGNASKWPTYMGISAVLEAILDAVYPPPSPGTQSP